MGIKKLFSGGFWGSWILSAGLLWLASIVHAEPGASFDGSHYVLSFYHWNIQYVLGSPKTEDLIVTQAFEPIIDLYARHPSWKVNFEMQGLMAQVLHDRHPAVFAKFKALVDNGQIELTSCHYSDQFTLAYPKEDMVRSMAINQKVFDDYGLKLSPVSFLQEDQFGEGIAELMASTGHQIAVVMVGLDQYLSHYDAPIRPYKGLDLVMIDHEGPNGPIWEFEGDAELAAIGKNDNPYFGYLGLKNFFLGFKTDMNRVHAMEDHLTQLESEGHQIASVSEYVAGAHASRAIGPEIEAFPDKMRGSFTHNVFLWMGDNHDPFGEDDIRVLSQGYTARNWLLAAQTAYDWAEKSGLPIAREKTSELDNLWRTQFVAEATDATGMGLPFPIEVRTSLKRSKDVIKRSQKLLDDLKTATGSNYLAVNTLTGSVQALDRAPQAQPEAAQDPACNHLEFVDGELPDAADSCGPVELTLSGGADVAWVNWKKITDNRWEVTFKFIPLLPRLLEYGLNTVRLKFARTTDSLIYSPSLLENEIREQPLSSFAGDEFFLPLSNGLIGLGDDLYVITENTKSHMAAHIRKDEKVISFDERNPIGFRRHEWTFTVFKGSVGDALKLADELNVHPILSR